MQWCTQEFYKGGATKIFLSTFFLVGAHFMLCGRVFSNFYLDQRLDRGKQRGCLTAKTPPLPVYAPGYLLHVPMTFLLAFHSHLCLGTTLMTLSFPLFFPSSLSIKFICSCWPRHQQRRGQSTKEEAAVVAIQCWPRLWTATIEACSPSHLYHLP